MFILEPVSELALLTVVVSAGCECYLEPVSELALLTVVVSAACECVHLGACE